MKISVRHRTYYAYAAAASQSYNQICLLPRDTDTQKCLQCSVDVKPEPSAIDYRQDQYGNGVASFNLSSEHRECDIVVTSMIETFDKIERIPSSSTAAKNCEAIARLHHGDALMASDCLLSSPEIPLDASVLQIVEELPIGSTPVYQYANLLTNHIFTTFKYESGFSTLVTPLADIIKARKGVCQDFAHLAISVLRHQGVPARYVSGYLETLPPPGKLKLQGADASHAWFAVYDADSGWLDFDPTNNKIPDSQYITTAWGRDYSDVVPIKGVVYGGGSHTLSVEVDVTRIDTSPTLVQRV